MEDRKEKMFEKMCSRTISSTSLQLFGLMDYTYQKKANLPRTKGSKLNILHLSLYVGFFIYI